MAIFSELFLPLFLLCALTGCMGSGDIADRKNNHNLSQFIDAPTVQKASKAVAEYHKLDGPKITVAVYSFTDKTGQRKPGINIAHLSSAVTQGGALYLIETLKEVGEGSWFKVVEREEVDNLIKERQIIRQTRELNNDTDKLKPLLFAGILIEGAIIGYDSSTQTGGKGARLLGVGVNSQYARDTVTVGLRLISVSTGEILLTSTTSKSIISIKTQGDIFRWVDMGTMPVESEIGRATNEPANIAVRKAIERAVVDIVDKGEQLELWKFKGKDKPNLIIE